MFLARLLVLLLVVLPGAGAWTQEACVWERSPGPVLASCPARARQLLDGLTLLAAEVSWPADRAEPVYSEIDYRACAAFGRGRTALLLRAAAPGAAAFGDDTACSSLCAVLGEVLRRASHGGLRPDEVLLDVDAPASSLAEFTTWLQPLRAECGTIPLILVVRPAWLGRPGLDALARAADGLVLQAYSAETPGSASLLPPLCDPARVAEWAAALAALGRPFRVALPTFGRLLAFRRDGHFLGSSPAGPRPSWPADVRLREQRADEAEMAELARYLRAAAPAGCTGLLWCPMPGAGESRGWGWIAFTAVLAGEDPAPRLSVACIQKTTTTWELVLRNDGTASAPFPAAVRAEWPGELRPSSIDGSGGFDCRADPEGRGADFLPRLRGGQTPRIGAGSTLVIGSLRFPGSCVPEAFLLP